MSSYVINIKINSKDKNLIDKYQNLKGKNDLVTMFELITPIEIRSSTQPQHIDPKIILDMCIHICDYEISNSKPKVVSSKPIPYFISASPNMIKSSFRLATPHLNISGQPDIIVDSIRGNNKLEQYKPLARIYLPGLQPFKVDLNIIQ